jgi:hypothetical protein
VSSIDASLRWFSSSVAFACAACSTAAGITSYLSEIGPYITSNGRLLVLLLCARCCPIAPSSPANSRRANRRARSSGSRRTSSTVTTSNLSESRPIHHTQLMLAYDLTRHPLRRCCLSLSDLLVRLALLWLRSSGPRKASLALRRDARFLSLSRHKPLLPTFRLGRRPASDASFRPRLDPAITSNLLKISPLITATADCVN